MREDNADVITGLLAGMSRELRCSICLNNFIEPTTTPCGHTFCRNCIEEILSNSDLCPSCSAEIRVEDLHIADSVREIMEEFRNMRDHYQQANNVILSQAPIAPLTYEDEPEERVAAHESPDTVDIPTSNVREAAEDVGDLVVYVGKGVDTIDFAGMVFVNEIDENTTHVVLRSSDKNRELVDCSNDYLLGILHGCSIVQSAWLERCAEDKRICPIRRYEITGNSEIGRTGAPEKARNDRARGKAHRLFRGLKFKFINDEKVGRRYERYIRIGGGIVAEHGDLVVCAEDMDDVDVDELIEKYPERKLFSKNWIDECICLYEIVKKDKYEL